MISHLRAHKFSLITNNLIYLKLISYLPKTIFFTTFLPEVRVDFAI